MALSRYAFSAKVANGKIRSNTQIASKIFKAAESGGLKIRATVLTEGQRLGHIAGAEYGDSTMWWIIAAASGIGWTLQVPPGTLIRIPTDLGQIYGLLP